MPEQRAECRNGPVPPSRGTVPKLADTSDKALRGEFHMGTVAVASARGASCALSGINPVPAQRYFCGWRQPSPTAQTKRAQLAPRPFRFPNGSKDHSAAFLAASAAAPAAAPAESAAVLAASAALVAEAAASAAGAAAASAAALVAVAAASVAVAAASVAVSAAASASAIAESAVSVAAVSVFSEQAATVRAAAAAAAARTILRML